MNADPNPAKAIFLEAVERHTPDQWPAFLDQACAGQPELRGQVEALLGAHREVGTAAHREVADDDGPDPAATIDQPPAYEQSGTVIGPYKLIEPIGEGGMGSVWMAQQTEPVKRLVAVKLIKAGMDSRQVIARFEAERQALALMDHPNIARVLDAGTTAAGRPYFVMDLVKGVSITWYCDEHHLTPRQRLELFLPVCQAVQHAHQKGIIHRDIKPSNVLVALYDGRPVPKVIDFGVAKAAGQPLTDKTLVTGFGAIVGTLEYMSPEQAETNQLDIDTRSDIYSLGVLLYELLTGSPPFSRKELGKAGILEMLRVIREQEPSKPSTKLSTADGLPTLAANRGTEPAKLTKLVRGELDWIVMKALEKDRSRRYETANGFAADVLRYLGGEAVLAVPPSAGYRLRKFARRHKVGLAAAAMVLFFLVLLGGGAGWAWRDRSAREAEATRQRNERQAKAGGQVESIFAEVDQLENEQKWPEALAAARRAEAVVAGGEADAATAERVRERLKDCEFVDRLERIRMRSATPVDGNAGNNSPQTDREYGQAFREHGTDLESLSVEQSIDRFKTRPALAIALAAELQFWADVRLRMTNDKSSDALSRRLIVIARGIDPEPFRDWLRSSWDKTVSAEEMRRVAGTLDIKAHRPTTLRVFADWLYVQDRNEAIALLRDAQRAHPEDFWLAFTLAYRLQVRKDFEEAARFYTAAISIRPLATPAYVNLGIVLGELKRLDEAVANFRRAIEIDPKLPNTHTNLGSALSKQNKLAEAIAAHRKEIEIDSRNATAYSNLGIVLTDQKKLDEAVVACKKAIEINPEFAPAYYSLGRALSGQNKLKEALVANKKSIDLNPNFAPAHNNLGNVLSGMYKLDEAIVAFKKAIEIDKKLTIAHGNLGLTFEKQNKLDEAIAVYQQAIEDNPSFVRAYHAMGVCFARQKKFDKAHDAFRRALKLEPNNATTNYNLGNLLNQEFANYNEAIACFQKAIEHGQQLPQAHVGLASLLATCPEVKYRDPVRAVSLAKKAIETTPADNVYWTTQNWQTLGWALYRTDDWKGSIAALEKSMALQPFPKGGDPGQWFCLAMNYWQLGEKEKAREWYDRAVAWMEKNAPKDKLLTRFREEAAMVLGVKTKKD